MKISFGKSHKDCADGTYLKGTVCDKCDASCKTCDIKGCAKCKKGLIKNDDDCVR